MSRTSTPGRASTRARPQRRAGADGATITPIGVDVGAEELAVAAAAEADPADAVAVSGKYARHLYKEFCLATARVSVADASVDDTNLGDLVARYWPRFEAAFASAADDVLAYARQHPAPVLVLEDLPTDPKPLVACDNGGARFATWVPPVAQAVLADRAVAAGVPVTYVDHHETTLRCHECGEPGEKAGGRVFRCTAPDCSVDEVDRDAGAAVTIARRGPYRPDKPL